MFRAIVILIAAQTAFAAQGLVLTQKLEDLQNGGQGTITIYLEPERVATINENGGRSQTFVYLADEKVMRIVDDRSKTYRELTQQDLERLSATVSDAMSKVKEQMAERMKNMTPEQRAMMEKMMGGRLQQMAAAQDGAQAASTTYKLAGGADEVAGHSCNWYEGYRQDKLVTKVCAADWDDFDFNASDFQVFRDMAEFIGKLAPGLADRIQFGSPADAKERFPGVPIAQTSYSDGKPTTKTTLEEYSRTAIPDSIYAAPEGYTRQQGFGR